MTLPVRSPLLGRMELLVNTVQELSLARDIESVMRIVRTTARELTGADGATFVLRDKDQCYYADEDAISPLWKGSRFPMKACISGWVMLNRQSVIIEDIYEDPRIPADAYRPTFVKSLLMVPIRTMDPIGAIGNYWASCRMPSEDEVMLLQSLADITAVSLENIEVRNTLEHRVSERTRELVESLEREKGLSEMKTAFVSMASHEFRTPLSAILSSISLLEKYEGDEQKEKRTRHLDRIRSSVSNLTNILDDFLSIDKLEQKKVNPEMVKFDLREFIHEVMNEVDGIRKPEQQIRYSHHGAPEVMLDKRILHNVMLNLLSNAIKYSETEIDLITDKLDGEMTITVVDRGIGIPESEQVNLFGKFFRASNASSINGTGLGLNIVKRYVDLLGGEISFTSREGIGTTFVLRFPLSDAGGMPNFSKDGAAVISIPPVCALG